MTTYREITTETEWETALVSSGDKPLLVLKHSTRCPVSTAALEEYEAYLADKPADGVDYVLVKVIEARPVSNKIAEDLGVKHESPQMILVKDKAKYWTTSHWSVTKKHMQAVLD
ncbi:bacillithiol system redox-active protein YtxJ [Paenibacillus sp. TRM 82003]|nr:bacillithiol system redox-active protein YtxJ [Paenibacillus sp. TRM 82003]